MLVVSTIGIWLLTRLTTLHNTSKAKTSLFNIGVLLGVASFIYLPGMALLLVAWYGLGTARPFKLPEWLMILLGLIAPAYFYYAIMFVFGQPMQTGFKNFHLVIPTVPYTKFMIASAVFLCVWLMAGYYYMQQNIRRQVVATRQNWGLLNVYMLVAVCMAFASGKFAMNASVLLMAPVAVVGAAAQFYPGKKWFPLLMHFAGVTLAIIAAFFA